MPKIDLSAEKWERKMEHIAPIWKKNTTKAVEENRYAKGIETFTGKPANPVRVELWKEGVTAVSEEDFAKAVRGKGDKWKVKYLDAMTV